MTLLSPATCPADDADLLRSYVDTHSSEAFRQLVDRHLPAIHATATRILRPKLTPHADDIAQAVFILLCSQYMQAEFWNSWFMAPGRSKIVARAIFSLAFTYVV